MSNEQNAPESRESRTGYGQTGYKRRLAYQYLGLRPADVQPAPFFRFNLRRITRCINQGGLRDKPCWPVSYVCLSDDPDAVKVAKAYLSVPASYRRLVAPEAYCQVARVSPDRILEIVTVVAMRFGVFASTVIASVMLPHVVEKTMDRARERDGFKERELICRLTGLIGRRF